MDDQQGMTKLAALITSLEDVSLPEPLRFWVDTENCALKHRGVVGLTDRSPEGTEERRAPYDEV